MLFTASKTDQYFPRYDPKSALISENGLLGFHSSLRKLLPRVASQESKTSFFWYSHVISAPAPQCEVFFDIPTLIKVASRLRTMSKMLQVLMSLGGKSQSFPTDSVSTIQLFFTNMAKCYHWVPISREMFICFPVKRLFFPEIRSTQWLIINRWTSLLKEKVRKE